MTPIVVVRDRPEIDSPRPLLIGDVVRDVRFPLAIERVSSFDGDTARVVFESGDTCFYRLMARVYAHADGAPIDGFGA